MAVVESIIESLRDDVRIEMEVNLPQRPFSRIEEFMRRIGGNNHDLAGLHFKGCRANGKSAVAFLDDKDFLVGMLMQPGTAPWGACPPIKKERLVSS